MNTVLCTPEFHLSCLMRVGGGVVRVWCVCVACCVLRCCCVVCVCVSLCVVRGVSVCVCASCVCLCFLCGRVNFVAVVVVVVIVMSSFQVVFLSLCRLVGPCPCVVIVSSQK